MKILSTFLLLFLFNFCCFGQFDSVKSRIIEFAKLQLAGEIGMGTNAYSFKKVIDSTYKYEFLKTKGFDSSVYFIMLSKRPDESKWNDSAFLKNNVYGSCEYILCYYEKTQLFYKLKGFLDNNVFLFFQHFSYLSRGYAFATILSRGNRESLIFNLKNKYIDLPRLDVLCLYDYWRNYLTGKITNSDCLKPCVIRDLEMMSIPNSIYVIPQKAVTY